MGLLNLLSWRSPNNASLPVIVDEESLSDDNSDTLHECSRENLPCDFQRSSIRPQCYRIRSSLLTKAIHAHDDNLAWSDLFDSDPVRSKYNTSSLELTSDSGLTSPASPSHSPKLQIENNSSFSTKSDDPRVLNEAQISARDDRFLPLGLKVPFKSEADNYVDPSSQPRKRSIVFACEVARLKPLRSRSRSDPRPHQSPGPQSNLNSAISTDPAPSNRRSIKFVCPGPQLRPQNRNDIVSSPRKAISEDASVSRSSSPLLQQSTAQDTSPVDKSGGSPEVIHSHVFAREVLEEDDWLRRDVEVSTSKLTINDTLKKENEIRRLASEAEEEAHINGDISEDELEPDDDDDEDDEDEDDDDDDDDEEEEEEEEEKDRSRIDDDNDEPDDGNETDNEAGFANSDGSDAEEFNFWSPGRQTLGFDGSMFRASALNRTASLSSIDTMHCSRGMAARRSKRSTRGTRPGTPDLPDSTDFVCGTLDEDRPLEEAYLSSKEARKISRHPLTPQDIDPSFPTSDVESEDELDEFVRTSIGAGPKWVASDNPENRESRKGRTSPCVILNQDPLHPHGARRLYSPPPIRRLLSPPPPSKKRFRSPPPRKSLVNTPRREGASPRTRLCDHRRSLTITNRPTLFSSFDQPIETSSSIATFHNLNASCFDDDDDNDDDKNDNEKDNFRSQETMKYQDRDGGYTQGHVRGAIDIVKGLEQRRQRRHEKLNQIQKNRKSKGTAERKPPPGQGAERMREIALLKNAKTGAHKPYILSA